MNLHRFDFKTIKNVEVRRKTFKTTQIYKTDQITMNCIDLMSKRSKYAKLEKQSNNDEFASIWRQNDQKMLSYVVKHSKQRKTTKEIKLQWIASIWHQNDLKCWDTSQNYKCDHITIYLHRFDVKTITTTQNYESDQIIMHCIDLMS